MSSDTGRWWFRKSDQLLPYGVFVAPGLEQPRVGVAVGAAVLDLTAASTALLPEHAELFRGGNLDALLGAGRRTWTALRAALLHWLAEERDVLESMCRPASGVTMRLPFTVADYVDFYSSEHHATNVGRMFRPGQPALPANWRYLPIAYHGRAGTVTVSGTPVTRPYVPRREADGTVCLAPSTALDFEAEVGFVVGTPSARPVPLAGFADHVFGLCLVNDWSARDVQRWESTPLGPFLGKSFATSISPWIVPLDALGPARVPPPVRDPRPLRYLDDT
ncbi:MAG TPA: fumarylacetoacetate hydrolase family protein, partial [Pseudonocardiaceae bacterium]|nr:fumarylacetoacetate hydrolase family protein [Pseudonocardiaceae bacterium]